MWLLVWRFRIRRRQLFRRRILGRCRGIRAGGGHYYSFIKDREDEDGKDSWYEFNDELVKEFDKDDLETECFGGEEKWGDIMGPSLYMKSSEKHRNAYVLFYERMTEEEIPYSVFGGE